MQPVDEIRVKPSHLAYYLYVAVLVISGSLQDTLLPGFADSLLQDLLVLAAFGLAGLYLFFRIHTRSALLFFGLAAAIGCCAYLCGGRTALLLTLLAVVMGDGANRETLLKLVFWLKLSIFLLTVAASLAGLLPGAQILTEGVAVAGKGQTLGYTHSNTFAATVGMLMLLYAAIHRHRMNLLRLLILLVIEALTFLLTRSRTGLIVMVLFTVGVLVLRVHGAKKLFSRLSGWILPALLILNFAMVIWGMLRPTDLLYQLDNSLFNGRMVLAGVYLNVYPLTLFGSHLDESLVAQVVYYYALDNGFTILLLHYGILGFAGFVIAWQLIVRDLRKRQEVLLLLISLCFCFWMIYEGIVLTVPGNFIFLMLWKETNPSSKERNIRLVLE